MAGQMREARREPIHCLGPIRGIEVLIVAPPCPDRGHRISSWSMNHLQKLGLASFFFLGLGLANGAVPHSTAGWSPQTAVVVALICYAIGLVLALLAFMRSQKGQSLNGPTKFLARAPLALVAIVVLIFFLRAMTGV